MSKYERLWHYIHESDKCTLLLTFAEIESIAGAPLDHSFLKYKGELHSYGYAVKKISIKEQTVIFEKTAK